MGKKQKNPQGKMRLTPQQLNTHAIVTARQAVACTISMAEEYGGIREEDIDGMHYVKPMTLADIIDSKATQLAQLGEQYERELQNLLDYIIYPHSHEEITIYAMELKHRLEEK